MKLFSLIVEITEKAASNGDMTFGQLAGIALIWIAMFVGLSLLINGWPNWFNKKK